MDWPQFIKRVHEHLATDHAYTAPFDDEHALTRVVALGLRRVFKDSFAIADPTSIRNHVSYRRGETEEDHRAYTKAKPYRHIVVRGLEFVPDVLIRQSLDDAKHILPIEIKLIRRANRSQALATGIGQCLMYSIRYPETLLFVGITRSAMGGRRGTADLGTQYEEDKELRNKLEGHGISVIFREVGE